MSTIAINRHFGHLAGKRSVDSANSLEQLIQTTQKMKLKVSDLFNMLKKGRSTKRVLELLENEIELYQGELAQISLVTQKKTNLTVEMTNILSHDILDIAGAQAGVEVEITGDIRSRFKGDFKLLSEYLSHLFTYIKHYLDLSTIKIDVYRSQGFVKFDFFVPYPLMLDDKMMSLTQRVMKLHFGKQSWLGGRLLLALPSTNT